MKARELITNMPHFVSIPRLMDDPRHPSEIINLLNVDYIQVFSDVELLLHFASGKTKILTGERAKSFIDHCFGGGN